MPQAKANLVIRLIIKHQAMTLAEISRTMGKEPKQGHSIGHERRTPTGAELRGLYKFTFWGWNEDVLESNDLFGAAVQMVERFESEGADFFSLVREGATTSLCIDLFDDSRVAGMLSPEQMQFLVVRGVQLGVELFHAQSSR